MFEMLPCDVCSEMSRDRWYKCLTCSVYNICQSCYDLKLVSLFHTPEHPMQCLITDEYRAIYYGGEDLQPIQMQSFTCPCCGIMGFTVVTLYNHLKAKHKKKSLKASCPLCLCVPHILVARPQDLITHLVLKHLIH